MRRVAGQSPFGFVDGADAHARMATEHEATALELLEETQPTKGEKR